MYIGLLLVIINDVSIR